MKLVGLALICTLSVLGLAPLADAGTAEYSRRPQPGDYCPFPRQGEKPACMIPAQRRYGEFFETVDEGRVSEIDEAHLARDLTASEANEESYLALSSLAYGYYRLAERAAASPHPDPALVARLEHWNRLLSSAYQTSPPRSHFRGALRRAAADLHERAPALGVACEEEADAEADCNPTADLLRSLEQLDQSHGFRGALSRLVRRMLGDGDE